MPLCAARSLGSLVFWAGLAASLSGALAACDGGDEAAGEGSSNAGEAGAPASSSGSADAVPRRPSRRYYMGRTAERCEVYTVEADAITHRGAAPCPAYIEVGERIRLAGYTCQREGTPGREQPVVCPGELLLAEHDDRAALAIPDAGPDSSVPDGSAPKRKKP